MIFRGLSLPSTAFIGFLWLSLAPAESRAQAFSNAAVGTTAAQFLNLIPTARETALGGTSAALTSGSNAIFWNPAGLARIEPQSPSEAGLSYAPLLETTYAGAASYAAPFPGGGVLGAGALYFSQAAQTAYSDVGNAIGSFTPYDLDLAVAYARRFGDYLVGGDAKFIRSVIADAHGQTAAVDAGFQAPKAAMLGDGPVDFGADITNLGGPLTVGTVGSPLPLKLAGGACWHATPETGFAMDLNMPEGDSPYVTLGFEGTLKTGNLSSSLRLGFNQENLQSQAGALSGFSLGAGLDFRRMTIDYAWVPLGMLGALNQISILYRF